MEFILTLGETFHAHIYFCSILEKGNENGHLTLIWVGPLGVRFEVGGGGWGKITPCLKLVRIMVKSTYTRKYIHIFSFRNHTFQYQGPLNYADVRIFLANNLHFFGKNSAFTPSNSVRAVLEIF